MVRKVLFIFLLLLESNSIFSQKLMTLIGNVSDASSTERLIGASIYTPDYKYYAVSNAFGDFQIDVPDTYLELQASYIGYEEASLSIDLNMSFALKPDNFLDSIFIQAPAIRQKQEVIGKVSMPISIAERLPQLFGSTDIMRSLTLYPGIQTGVEGTSGLFVRGGGPGQNLILLDENKVYNNAHLFGFSSVFNPNVVKTVDLYKSGFPAQYGGRISSIVSINTIDGNREKAETKISVGLLESGISTQGPIKNLNATYVLAGRVFYLSAISLPNLIRYNTGKSNSYQNYFFYDLNGKIRFKLTDNQAISLSFFKGDDTFVGKDKSDKNFQANSNALWGNELINLRYSNQLRKKHFLNINLLRNRYSFRLRNNVLSGIESSASFENLSSILEYEVNLKAQYKVNNNLEFNYGASITNPRYSPFGIESILEFENTKEILKKNSERQFFQQGYFSEVKFSLIKNLSITLGNRIDNYNIPTFKKLYYSPRVNVQYANGSYKFSLTYDKSVQFEHLISGNNGGVPSDIFVSSDTELLPQLSNQYALGFFKNFANENLSINADLFYRSLNNQILFIPNFLDLYLSNSRFQDNLVKNGQGEIYGFEFFLRQEKAKFQYSFSYTFLYNKRRFENFNNGKPFNAAFSRQNDLQFNLNYILNKKISLNFNLVYSTGHFITLPSKVFIDQLGYASPIIDAWNGVKSRDYNRGDLGVTYRYKKKNRDVKWKFGIYNFYGYQNPMFYEYGTTGTFKDVSGRPVPVEQRSVIYGSSNFIIIPSITYETKF